MARDTSEGMSRRDFIRLGAAAGGIALGGTLASVQATQHPHARPQISGYFIPPQAGHTLEKDYREVARDVDVVFVEWDRKLMWVGTGLYLVSSPALGAPVLKPMPVQEWALPGLNAGHA